MGVVRVGPRGFGSSSLKFVLERKFETIKLKIVLKIRKSASNVKLMKIFAQEFQKFIKEFFSHILKIFKRPGVDPLKSFCDALFTHHRGRILLE